MQPSAAGHSVYNVENCEQASCVRAIERRTHEYQCKHTHICENERLTVCLCLLLLCCIEHRAASETRTVHHVTVHKPSQSSVETFT